MDYPCGMPDDCSLSCFGSIMWTDRQMHAQSDVDVRFTPAAVRLYYL